MAQQSHEYHIDKIKTTHSINREIGNSNTKQGENGSIKSQIEAQSSAAYGYINNASSHSGNNRRRQLLSIDSNNPAKKKTFKDTGDFGGNIELAVSSNYDNSNNLGNSGYVS